MYKIIQEDGSTKPLDFDELGDLIDQAAKQMGKHLLRCTDDCRGLYDILDDVGEYFGGEGYKLFYSNGITLQELQSAVDRVLRDKQYDDIADKVRII